MPLASRRIGFTVTENDADYRVSTEAGPGRIEAGTGTQLPDAGEMVQDDASLHDGSRQPTLVSFSASILTDADDGQFDMAARVIPAVWGAEGEGSKPNLRRRL